jgi:AspT/YidE/YbjL antiporter-like protein
MARGSSEQTADEQPASDREPEPSGDRNDEKDDPLRHPLKVSTPPDGYVPKDTWKSSCDRPAARIRRFPDGLPARRAAAGLALGLGLGLVPFPFPGPGSFELGSAGGPVIVALCLGALGRTGPFVWQIPHGANLTLRQLGIVLLLAGIGTRAGESFGATIADSRALLILASGVLVTSASVGLAAVVGLRILRLDAATLGGVIAGIQTQPAVLAFATERSDDEREVNLG